MVCVLYCPILRQSVCPSYITYSLQWWFQIQLWQLCRINSDIILTLFLVVNLYYSEVEWHWIMNHCQNHFIFTIPPTPPSRYFLVTNLYSKTVWLWPMVVYSQVWAFALQILINSTIQVIHKYENKFINLKQDRRVLIWW